MYFEVTILADKNQIAMGYGFLVILWFLIFFLISLAYQMDKVNSRLTQRAAENFLTIADLHEQNSLLREGNIQANSALAALKEERYDKRV